MPASACNCVCNCSCRNTNVGGTPWDCCSLWPRRCGRKKCRGGFHEDVGSLGAGASGVPRRPCPFPVGLWLTGPSMPTPPQTPRSSEGGWPGHSPALGPLRPPAGVAWPPGVLPSHWFPYLCCCFNWPQFSSSVAKTLENHTRVISPFFTGILFSARSAWLVRRPVPSAQVLAKPSTGGFLQGDWSRVTRGVLDLVSSQLQDVFPQRPQAVGPALRIPMCRWVCCCSCLVAQLWPHGLRHSGFTVLHSFPEFAQTHVHWVSDALQPSCPCWWVALCNWPQTPPLLNVSYTFITCLVPWGHLSAHRYICVQINDLPKHIFKFFPTKSQ